jgi:hypothetical protein
LYHQFRPFRLYCLQIAFRNLYLIILDVRVRESSQLNLAFFILLLESDLKAKYDEIKARFKQPVESRDIKFVDIEVQASNADRAALNKEFAGYHSQLAGSYPYTSFCA